MGISRHKKKHKGKKKEKKLKPETKKTPSLMTDAALSKLSSKICEMVMDKPSSESIRRLFVRNMLSAEQYVLVLEHAEMKLDESIKYIKDNADSLDMTVIKPVIVYEAAIEFLNNLRKYFANFFKVEETTNILRTYGIHERR